MECQIEPGVNLNKIHLHCTQKPDVGVLVFLGQCERGISLLLRINVANLDFS